MTTRQKTKLRNAFTNNISADIKLNEAQLSKIIQSGVFLGAFLSNFVEPLMKVVAALAQNVLVPLATMASASVIDGASKENFLEEVL